MVAKTPFNLVAILKVGCKTPFNLVAIIGMNVDLKNELEAFEIEFEREEIVDVWKFGKHLIFLVESFCGSYMFLF